MIQSSKRDGEEKTIKLRTTLCNKVELKNGIMKSSLSIKFSIRNTCHFIVIELNINS